MRDKKFKVNEKAWISDLNKVENYTHYECGYFEGMLRGCENFMGYTKDQISILKKHINNTFNPKNFNWFGKRKKDSYIIQEVKK